MALAEADYSEARLERLLAAENETLHALALRAARYLAAQGIGCDWADIARLLVARSDDSIAAATHRIATDYYRTLRAQEKTDKRTATP